MRLVRVAVPVPALDSLTYSLPDSLENPVVGARVLVPLGNRVLTGCVVGDADLTFQSVLNVGLQPAAILLPVVGILAIQPGHAAQQRLVFVQRGNKIGGRRGRHCWVVVSGS